MISSQLLPNLSQLHSPNALNHLCLLLRTSQPRKSWRSWATTIGCSRCSWTRRTVVMEVWPVPEHIFTTTTGVSWIMSTTCSICTMRFAKESRRQFKLPQKTIWFQPHWLEMWMRWTSRAKGKKPSTKSLAIRLLQSFHTSINFLVDYDTWED